MPSTIIWQYLPGNTHPKDTHDPDNINEKIATKCWKTLVIAVPYHNHHTCVNKRSIYLSQEPPWYRHSQCSTRRQVGGCLDPRLTRRPPSNRFSKRGSSHCLAPIWPLFRTLDTTHNGFLTTIQYFNCKLFSMHIKR